LLGGRVAEALTLEDISTGASNDIERATEIARRMVTKFGMSDKLGPICYAGSDNDEVFLGRDFGHTRNYSEEMASKIDAEINGLIQRGYSEARRKLNEHMAQLHEVAQYLIDNEKMSGEEFIRMMERTAAPMPPVAE
ncbi:MAG: ATP-dependent zinc metalloprotease FtsH, partial [Clostridia bacterium]|nr:ATP-dependent zinc metalloprotease FtsH [Clostridia bacterium]